jgi:threonine dehydrogenase-like Zn-dependent dehydrogenase
MRGAVKHGPGEVRVEEREAPQIVEPTDAIIRVSAACVCGSDLWPYRGKVFDLHLPLEDAAEGYRAMDQRDAIKTLLRP